MIDITIPAGNSRPKIITRFSPMCQFSSVQFSSPVMCGSLRPRGLQYTRLPCPSQLLELAQTHVHRVSDAIQPSYPLLSPSPPYVSVGLKCTELLSAFVSVRASLIAQMVKNLPTMQETRVRSLGWEDPLEKGWLPSLVFLPREFHGQRSLVGYSP